MKMLAYHLDFKRAMWKRSYLERFLDRLQKWGYTALVCEMEDKFRFSRHPLICHPDAWGHTEASAFAENCRKRGLAVIPLMQSLGHLEFIVGKSEYAYLREAPELTTHIDATNPESIRFLIKLYDEIIDVMKPAQYFHLGGDETLELGNSKRCASLMRKHGRGGLYLQHMLPLWEHIYQRGLTPIIWADMALTHPEVIAKIPRYVALMDWEYFTMVERPRRILVWGGFGKGNRLLNWSELRKQADKPFCRNLMRYAADKQTLRDGSFRAFYCTDALVDKKFKVWAAPTNRCSGDLIGIPLSSRHVPNCYYFARKGVHYGAGALVTSWAVRHNHPEVDLPGTYAAAWGLKRTGAFDAAEFWKAYAVAMYGAELPGFGDAVNLAEKGEGIALLQARFLQEFAKVCNKKQAILTQSVANLTKEKGGKKKTRSYLENILKDYEKAAGMFKRFRKLARCNAGNIDFWLEGVALDDLLVRLIRAALTGSLSREKNILIRALKKSRNQTRKLFAGTYCPDSLKEELDVRYGFIGKCLDVCCL